jgi:hypothetical protein
MDAKEKKEMEGHSDWIGPGVSVKCHRLSIGPLCIMTPVSTGLLTSGCALIRRPLASHTPLLVTPILCFASLFIAFFKFSTSISALTGLHILLGQLVLTAHHLASDTDCLQQGLNTNSLATRVTPWSSRKASRDFGGSRNDNFAQHRFR